MEEKRTKANCFIYKCDAGSGEALVIYWQKTESLGDLTLEHRAPVRASMLQSRPKTAPKIWPYWHTAQVYKKDSVTNMNLPTFHAKQNPPRLSCILL